MQHARRNAYLFVLRVVEQLRCGVCVKNFGLHCPSIVHPAKVSEVVSYFSSLAEDEVLGEEAWQIFSRRAG